MFERLSGTKIVLEEENVPLLLLQLSVPTRDPLLIKFRRHPGLRIISIIESKRLAALALECTRLCPSSNDDRRKLLGPIRIGGECICDPRLDTLDTRAWFVRQATIQRHTVSSEHQSHVTSDSSQILCIAQPSLIHIENVLQWVPNLLDHAMDSLTLLCDIR